MDVNFNIYEVFELADKIEETGSVFYREAAGRVCDSESVAELLLELAEMEEAHKSYFKSLKSKFDIVGAESLIDLEDQTTEYLRSLGKSHVVHSLSSVLNDTEPTAENILNIAIKFEKESVEYFEKLLSVITDDTEKSKVANIVVEEKEHVKILTDKLKEQVG